MRTFVFRVEHLGRDPVVKTRTLDGDIEASAYGRQLLKDWPDCAAIEISQAGELVDRLRPQQP
jgi:hypothetical protein